MTSETGSSLDLQHSVVVSVTDYMFVMFSQSIGA